MTIVKLGGIISCRQPALLERLLFIHTNGVHFLLRAAILNYFSISERLAILPNNHIHGKRDTQAHRKIRALDTSG